LDNTIMYLITFSMVLHFLISSVQTGYRYSEKGSHWQSCIGIRFSSKEKKRDIWSSNWWKRQYCLQMEW
jgi:hypothetical protein